MNTMTFDKFCKELHKRNWVYNGMNEGPSFTHYNTNMYEGNAGDWNIYVKPLNEKRDAEYIGDDKITTWISSPYEIKKPLYRGVAGVHFKEGQFPTFEKVLEMLDRRSPMKDLFKNFSESKS